MKILFVLPQFGLSGGVHIVFKVAEILAHTGDYDIVITLPDTQPLKRSRWLTVSSRVSVKSYADASTQTYDIVFSTWWKTLLTSTLFKARTYALFMQALEGAFYRWGDPEQDVYDYLIESNVFPCITIARWLVNYASKPAYYFLYALDKSIFRPTPPLVQHKDEKELIFLLEGPISDPRKNLIHAINFLEKNSLKYIWVGADADKAYVGRNCVALFSGVPLHEMAGIYSSADVLLKLSNIEGMFGPPLEMFSCGGTAICWDVWGSEEYMVHGYNSLLCPMNNFSSLLDSVNALIGDRDLLNKLKVNAKKTADAWPSWIDISQNIVKCINEISRIENKDIFLDLIDQTVKRFSLTPEIF